MIREPLHPAFLHGLRSTVGFFLLALLWSAPAAAGADWPCFRGPSGQGTSAEKGLPATWSAESNIAWKVRLPGPGVSSPIIVGDRVIVTCYSGFKVPGEEGGDPQKLQRHLVSLDISDGKVAWSTSVPAKLPEQEKIREDHGYASSTPACDGRRIYTFFGVSGAFAFDLKGKKLWQADVGSASSGWGSAASPVVHGDLVFVNASVESESLVALDAATGKEKWRAPGIRESWNTPILVPAGGGKTELVVAIAGKILGFDPASGEQLWSCDTDIGWYMVPSLVAADGVVYSIGGRSGGALAVRVGGRGDVTATHRVWTGKKGSNVSSLVHHAGHLYWTHENLGIAYCAEAKTGEIVFEERLPRGDQFYASAVAGDGKLYLVNRSGKTWVLALEPEFKVLSVNDPPERDGYNSSPAIAAGSIFLRSDRFLFRIGKGSPPRKG